MYQLKTTVYTETAHFLDCHKGKCHHIHGHSYKWTVKIESEDLNINGMVMDFAVLKDIVRYNIVDTFDHTIVVGSPVSKDAARTIEALGKLNSYRTRFCYMKGEPTAENFAKNAYDSIKAVLPIGINMVSVACRETRNNEAIYYEVKQP